MTNDNMQYHTKLRQWKMNELQNKMGTQQRIKNLRDDPIAAARSVRYSSHITRLEQFSKNVDTVTDTGRIAEGYMQEAVSILQRVRELAITGANGTFTKEDTRYMAEEVNQLLEELVEIGNAQSGDGTNIFAGDRNLSKPFRAVYGHAEGKTEKVITNVEYVGTIGRNMVEVSENSFVRANYPGNRVFWAEPMTVLSDVDAGNYQVLEDAVIKINGEPIQLRTGDNIYAIIAKINDSGTGVKAVLDPVKNSLVLRTTTPHQMWVEDADGGTVMRDLGILKGSSDMPPGNYAPDALVSGGSMYDMVLNVRDRLLEGDGEALSGSGIRGVDDALNSLLTSMAELGALDERLQTAGKRLTYEKTEMIGRNTKEVGLDMTRAITDLKMLEYTHQASLQTAGRILRPTLLDFLR